MRIGGFNLQIYRFSIFLVRPRIVVLRAPLDIVVKVMDSEGICLLKEREESNTKTRLRTEVQD